MIALGFLALSTVATAALTPVARAAGVGLGLIDEPDPRRVHVRPIPRSGGLAIGAGLLVSVVAAAAFMMTLTPDEVWLTLPQLITVVTACGFAWAIGLLDDFIDLPGQYKLGAVLCASAALPAVGVAITGLATPDVVLMSLGVLAWPVTMLWLTGVTVSVNFIDGLDGLAAGVVAIVASVLAVLCFASGEAQVGLLALLLAGSLCGFLIFNRHPASIFMGDSGSTLIGFALACLSVLAAEQLGTLQGLVVPACGLAVPIADSALTMFRRHFIQRQPMFSAERGHVHHRLLDSGMPHHTAVLLLWGVAATGCLIGAVASFASGWSTLGVLALMLPLVYGTCRFAGSVRARQMLAAVRRKRHLDQDHRRVVSSTSELQSAFARCRDLNQWWQTVGRAGESLGLAGIRLTVPDRSGASRDFVWTDPGLDTDLDPPRMSAKIPVRGRRSDDRLLADVEVVTDQELETAGHRIAAFTRLMSDHGIDSLPSLSRQRSPRRQSLAVRLARDVQATRGEGHDELPESLSIAIVHDFLYTYAGAERVLEQMVNLFPDADLFSLFDFLPEGQRDFIHNKPVKTSLLQNLPGAARRHRAMLPLMPFAVEQLDVTGYDLVLSSSYIAAKGVLTGPDQLHLCYCHSPARYAWDLQHEYLHQSKLGYSLKALIARGILHYIRTWDARSALGVDHFISNSRFIARRIQKLYRRPAEVIYPPVDVESFPLCDEKKDYYVTASRLVPYKRIDLIIDAFRRMPDRQLVVVGGGPGLEALRDAAPANVRLTGHVPHGEMTRWLGEAKAFIFAAEEDFGIVPVEAMATGTPVIAFNRGGVTESVIAGETGLFFDEQSAESIEKAVRRFEQTPPFDPSRCRQRAMRFSSACFRERFERSVRREMQAFCSALRADSAHDALDDPYEPQTPSTGRRPDAAHATASNGNGNGHGSHATPPTVESTL
jgi:UDP-N-acetylmuramyl pentapeptide phosphotransferase/UDP-N-acetylglucosamine-1-phosphate transferase/glycosyltransferase involved in cell wall biosynthesis